ncbi:hypothetical protein GCM10029978_073740 [Actinoallomurus acanthiterrae]
MSSGERPLSEARYLTVAEVAAVMHVSKMTVYRLVHSGELPAIRVGRSFRVPELAVHDYLREQAAQEVGVTGRGPARHANAGQSSVAPSGATIAHSTDLAPTPREIPLDTDVSFAVVARQAVDRDQIIYLTEHGERLAAVVPADVAAELSRLDSDELAELLEEVRDTAAARRGLESIAAGEPVIPWEDVQARLEL